MCPHSAIYLPSGDSLTVDASSYMYIYMSSYYVLILLYMCVLILLYICPQVIHHSQSFQSLTSTSSHSLGSQQSSESIGYSQGDDVDDETLRMLLQALYLSAYYYACPHTAIHVSSNCYVCVLILRLMCPHTAVCVRILLYVSAYCYICVLMLVYCNGVDKETLQDAAAHPRCLFPY
jgi:hypothetical protein